jgi:tryptophanyl-tRNA synthetase
VTISGITFNPVKLPGTTLLLSILSACTGEAPAVLAERYGTSNHGALKKGVPEAVEEALQKPRAKFAGLRGEETFLEQVARDGAEKAQEYSRTSPVGVTDVTNGVGLGLVIRHAPGSTRPVLYRRSTDENG